MTNKLAARLYFMSEIIPYQSYEDMFDKMINEEKVNLQEQLMYTHALGQDKKALLQQVSSRLKSY